MNLPWRGKLSKTGPAAALLLLCAALPYANAVLNGFAYDDSSQLLDNPYVRSFAYTGRIFTSSVWSFAGRSSHYYRPVMTFGYLLCYKLFGFSPHAFHLVSVLLHAAVVWLVFLVTLRLFGGRALAFAAAAIFALHPIHTESVAWIAAVTDLELTLFYLAAFGFFLAVGRPWSRFRAALVYSAMLAACACALLSKEQAATLPLLATVYEHFYRDDRARTTLARKVSRYGGLWVLLLLYLPLRSHFLGGFAVVWSYHLERHEVLFSAVALFGQYLGKLLWPARLSAFYVFHKSAGPLEAPVLLGLLAVLVVAALFVSLWKRARLATFGLIWMAVTLLPVLNAKWVGLNAFAERYLYLPSVGFCWVAAWALMRLWDGSPQRRVRAAMAAALALLALACALRIAVRNRDWRNDLVLFTRTLAGEPDATLIRRNLAAAYKSQGLLEDAEREYQDALERDPDCADCLNDMGWLYLEQGRQSKARELFTRAIELDSSAVSARLNLGLLNQDAGLVDDAERQFRKVVAMVPADPRAHLALGGLYRQRGDPARAEAAIRRALALNPYSVQAHLMLGNVYAAAGRKQEAIREYEAALENDPASPAANQAVRKLRDGSGAN